MSRALPKLAALTDLHATWHFIGRIQSNKTRTIAAHFDWIHTVDRTKIAKRLNEQCPAEKKLQILLQVNIDDDPAKGGAAPAALPSLLADVAGLPQLTPRGLMTILAVDADPHASYKSMAQLLADLRGALPAAAGARWDTLSMGMSNDLEQAIAQGATHIRIGTALFGARG